MTTIILKPLDYKGGRIIGIYFDKNIKLNTILQKVILAKWSNSLKCWYMDCTKEQYTLFTNILNNYATIDASAMKKWFEVNKDIVVQHIKIATNVVAKSNTAIHTINNKILPKLKQHLQLKAYSNSTIKTYLSEMGAFLKTIKNNAADDFTTERIKDYLQYCFVSLHLSENTLHSRINALKYYYENVLGKEKFFWDVPRPKKKLMLPKFFNKDEIASIINATDNLKHKTMLMLAYSSGLRVSEVVNIKTYNIDSKRMSINIENAKGKKDRFVALSPILLVMLREYAKQYKIAGKGYLFEGQTKGECYSTRSLQLVLNAAKQKAGILKPGSIHSLRHSFATHLVDKGTDITMIQKLMGHNDIKTTMIYLHTSNKDLLKIMSPLDELDIDLKIKGKDKFGMEDKRSLF